MDQAGNRSFDGFSVDYVLNSPASVSLSDLGSKREHIAPIRKHHGAVYGCQTGYCFDRSAKRPLGLSWRALISGSMSSPTSSEYGGLTE